MTSEGWATTDTGDGWKVWTATSFPHWAWDRQPLCSSPHPTVQACKAAKAQQAGTVLKHPAWRSMTAQSLSTGQVATRAGSPSCDATEKTPSGCNWTIEEGPRVETSCKPRRIPSKVGRIHFQFWPITVSRFSSASFPPPLHIPTSRRPVQRATSISISISISLQLLRGLSDQ